MNLCYRVELSEAERAELQGMLSSGKHAARKLKRAQILLAANAGVPDETIAQSVVVGGSTVYRTKLSFGFEPRPCRLPSVSLYMARGIFKARGSRAAPTVVPLS